MIKKLKNKVFKHLFNEKYPVWDYGYFLQLQLDQLLRMRDYYLSGKSFIEGADKVGIEIDEAITVLQRLVDDNYHDFDYPDCFDLRIKDLQRYHELLEENLFGWWD